MFLRNLKRKSLLVVGFLGLIALTFLFVNNSSYAITRFKNAFYAKGGSESDVSSREIHWKSVINTLKTKKEFRIF